METLPNGFTIDICPGAFPLSTDSMVLSYFVRLPGNARVLDLGSGCGTLGLMLCATNSSCQVTGIELTEAAHNAALENIRRNNLHNRLSSICADFRNFSWSQKPFDVCISNPPYYSGGPASKSLPIARRNDTCSSRELFFAAAKALKFGGDFFVIQKPESLAELCAAAVFSKLEPKKLCLVRHKAGDQTDLILLQCRKGAKPGLRWDEWILHDALGNPTELYRKIYHI